MLRVQRVKFCGIHAHQIIQKKLLAVLYHNGLVRSVNNNTMNHDTQNIVIALNNISQQLHLIVDELGRIRRNMD